MNAESRSLSGTVRVTVGFIPLITCLPIGSSHICVCVYIYIYIYIYVYVYIFFFMFAACSSKQPMSSVSVPHIARSYTPASSAGKKTRRRRENDVPLFRVHARRPVWVASALQKCKRHCHERFNTFQRVKLANEAREFMLRHVTNEKERWHVLCDAPFSWKNIYSLMNFYLIYLFQTNVL